jgi:hypothetical protein
LPFLIARLAVPVDLCRKDLSGSRDDFPRGDSVSFKIKLKRRLASIADNGIKRARFEADFVAQVCVCLSCLFACLFPAAGSLLVAVDPFAFVFSALCHDRCLLLCCCGR